MTAKEKLEVLVENYEKNRDDYIRSDSEYSETDARAEFIDPFLSILGWDINNSKGLSSRLREVERETRVTINENIKKPDYELKLGFQRKIFIEAKKPSINLITSNSSAFQTRRYGWSAELFISVLTNFEDLIIYDTTIEPDETDPPERARLKRYNYSEYVDNFDEIRGYLSRDVIYSGEFDEYFGSQFQVPATEKVGNVFLDQLNTWRLELASDINQSENGYTERELNEITQRILLRILFLRMCEDRGIQTYEALKDSIAKNDWEAFLNLLQTSDQRFDTSLFRIDDDPFFTNDLVISTDLMQSIVESLYYPESPYQFSVFEPEFLGNVYERFLDDLVFIDEEDEVHLRKKPESIDKDIVSTPREIVEVIVQDTLLEDIESVTIEEIFGLRIIDPACGSGGFLISAYSLLLDQIVQKYKSNDNYDYIYETFSGYKLKYDKKRELLQNCIFGADRDYSAIEVTKFSLFVKLFEDENSESIPLGNNILPELNGNVVFGDSLIDSEASNGQELIGIPLDWGVDLPDSFHFVIGNPPYLNTEDMKNLEKIEYEIYQNNYYSAYKQFDKYFLFIEKAVEELLAKEGKLGMIVSKKFSHIESGKKIRKLLSRDCEVTQIADFGNAQLFEDKTTYTCLLYITNIDPDDKNDLLYTLINTPKKWIAKQSMREDFQILPRRIVSGDDCWILPNTTEEADLIERLSQQTIQLKDLMDVYNGIQTSRNTVYVIDNWTEVGDEIISFEKNDIKWEIEKDILKPFFDSDKDKLNAYKSVSNYAYVVFPYNVNNENGEYQDEIISPDTLRSDYPRAWAYFLYHSEDLKSRSITPKDYPKEEWYRYGRKQAITSFEDRQKIIVGVNSKGDKYVIDDSDILLASGGTAGECAISHFRNSNSRSLYDLYFIHAILMNKAIEYFCRKRGSAFRGGWYARGTSVLEEIPIPQIDFSRPNDRLAQYAVITDLSRRLHELSNQIDDSIGSEKARLKRRFRNIKKEIDSRINSLYEIENLIDQIELP